MDLIVSVSAVLLLAVVVIALCRRGGLKTWHAVVCALFGFYLASSAVAPTVRQVAEEIARVIGGQ